VILFHAGFTLFSGGFIGVDVFFVISGYLITTILIEDIENKRFSIVNFYERRARRILPALFFVMLVCIPFAWMWMLPNQLKDFSQSLVAVILFASNILFWLESDYFDGASEEKPLLHTWSLAVEEQYYVLFPIFLFLTWRFGKNRVFWTIVVFAAISFALSEWGWRNQASASFYLAPTRAWELLAGSITAFVVQKRGVQANNALSTIGLAAIIFAVFAYDENTPFPSVYALVPVIGVVLLVLFADKQTLAAKLLGTKLFVGIGLISYSAYLWHQPLFAFARIMLFEEPSSLVMLALSAVSVVLAMFSWRYIETPFRQNRMHLNSRIVVFLFAIGGMICYSIIGYLGFINNGYRDRMPILNEIEWTSMSDRIDVQGYICEGYENERYPFITLCEFGDKSSDNVIVAYGDSHLDAVSYELDLFAKRKNIRVVKLSIDNCAVIFDITSQSEGANLRAHYKVCNQGFLSVRNFINDYSADALLISRWTFQFYPAPGVVDYLNFDNGVGGVEVDLAHRINRVINSDGDSYLEWNVKEAAFRKMLDGFVEASDRVFVVTPIPEIGWNIFNENLNNYRNTGELISELKYPISKYYERNSGVLKILRSVRRNSPSLKLVPSDELFCKSIVENFCVAQIQKTPLYLDDDHLSDYGARILVDSIENLMFPILDPVVIND